MLLGALLASTLLVCPPVARAASTGSGGWYWPVGTENFQGWDGWWEYRPQHPVRWHMAQDMPSPVGHAVYAVGDGTVIESGGDHGYGGVIVVLHRTGTGEYFKAVYGHIFPAHGTAKGAKVKAGQVIGRVNGCRHVHFGIHPGKKYPPDNNPYRGHTYTSKNTYGWVDPVAYLRTHPRVVVYPAVPVIATIETTEQPTILGVADGSAYWTTGAADSLHAYSRTLAEGSVVELAADEPVPDVDTTRFLATTGAGSFTLSDRLPVLTLASSSAAPAWKHSVSVSGRLTNASGVAFVGVPVVLESSLDGIVWTRLRTALTGPTGGFSASWTPMRRAAIRASFAAAAGYLTASSAPATVAPRPALSAPVLPSGADHGRDLTIKAGVRPRHAAGASEVVLRIQRKVAGVWTDHSSIPTVYRDSGAYSLCQCVARLPEGAWRMRTQSPTDSLHASGVSSWTYVTFR